MYSLASAAISTSPDVLVIGGGAAGVAAAVAAAANGSSVTLLERNSYAGGKATASYVATICGLYYRSLEDNPVFVHGGFPKEFALRLAERSNTCPYLFKDGLHFLPYNHFEFILACDEWLKQSGVSVGYHSTIIGTGSKNNLINIIEALVNNRRMIFTPKSIVDTSGENLVTSLMGLKGFEDDTYQAASMVFQLSGISETDETVLNLSMIRCIKKGVDENKITAYYQRLSIVPGSARNGMLVLKLPLPFEPDRNSSRTDMEIFSRKAVHELFSFLKINCELFSGSSLCFIAPEAGIRTGPRNIGKVILTADKVLNCIKDKTAVARGSWPVEFWEPGKNLRMEYFQMNDYYDIPAGALQSDTFQNLFFGGRNISADKDAIASARVIGTCLATGYAAGVMASAEAAGKSMDMAVTTIQSQLCI